MAVPCCRAENPAIRVTISHTTRKLADDVRGKLLTQLEGVAGDLEKLLEEARANDGKQPKCPQCGGFIPGVSKLTLKDTLMALRELRAVLPAQT